MASITARPVPAPQASLAIVLFALAMGGFAIGTTEFAAMALVPWFSADLAISPAAASHVISAYALGVVVGAPILSMLGARLDRKRFLVILAAMLGLANIAAAFAPTYHAMLVLRFLAGVPHGAYFGVASLMAASLVAPARRTWAVSMVMTGLTVATVLGVPAATVLGQTVGWRWGFVLVGGLGMATCALIARHAPAGRGNPGAHPLRELSALGKRQVWITLAIGSIGFGGIFAVYTYVSSTLLAITQAPAWAVPVVIMIFGLGLFTGVLVVGRIADCSLMGTAAVVLTGGLVVFLIYPFTVHSVVAISACVFLIGCTAALSLPLQTRLMDVAGEAQTLAAALNHSAFNIANALGPFVVSVALDAGYGLTVAGPVGAGLAAIGLALVGLAVWDDRRRASASLQPCE